jgi:ferric-dicitrate binding protein FerR (iron transport regulator)
MSKYNDILKNWEAPLGKSNDQAWVELQHRLNSAPQSDAKVIRFSWKPTLSVAAAAALIIGLILLWPNQPLQQVATANGKRQTVVLPDNSTVELNASTTIEFADDWSGDREVKLSGQAFFEVVKGGKFEVATPQGVVEVLGTSFDVCDRENVFEVTCRTGKVRVAANGGEVEIVPGLRATLTNGKLVVSDFDLALADWRSGEFHYQEAPLNQVLDEIERQFDVQVQWPDLGSRFYTGRFNTKDLNEALQLICLPMGLQFEVKDTTVWIREKEINER